MLDTLMTQVYKLACPSFPEQGRANGGTVKRKRLKRRIRKLERAVAALTTEPTEHELSEPLDIGAMWRDQVERYEHGGWDGQDWNPRGYL